MASIGFPIYVPPSSRSYSPGTFPQQTFESQNGAKTVLRYGSKRVNATLNLGFSNIEDALAMGPAVSILLDGYVDKGKIVSLRGTLVPATKLNSIIASIPVVGEILVGKKTGEGVVGVSFKMKGVPGKIKTTVNPIKTLTPRFITKALEKRKKAN